MPKPVCVKCQCFFRPKRNGIGWIEGMPEQGAARGLREPEKWRPYKLWVADLWECPDCKFELVVGNSGRPVSEHYKEDFDKMVEIYTPKLQVNDC